VLVYTYWPSNKKPFEHAAMAVVSDEEDKPCQ
jgi:cytochrome c oxidase cbb3-type subunit IV